MIPIKSILSIFAVALTFIGFVPYIRDTIRGKTIPHIYSWGLGTFATGLIFALQVTGGAGAGAYPTLVVSILCGVITVLSLRMKGKKDIVLMDSVCFFFALAALILWVFAKQPIISTILITMSDILGFVPTVRKTWKKPFSETLSFYFITAARYGLIVLAVDHYSIVTALYPFTWLVINTVFSFALVARRKQVKPS